MEGVGCLKNLACSAVYILHRAGMSMREGMWVSMHALLMVDLAVSLTGNQGSRLKGLLAWLGSCSINLLLPVCLANILPVDVLVAARL